MKTDQIIKRAKKKAEQSICRYKISALGFNKRGELLYSSINKKRFPGKGRGLHAEMNVMKHSGPGLDIIYICRINESGELLPIDPCNTCLKKAQELNIKIISISDNM